MKTLRKIHYDVYISIVMIAVGAFFLYGASLIKVDVSRIVPELYSYLLIGLSVLLMIDGIIKTVKANKETGDPLPHVNGKEVFWGVMTWVAVFLYYIMFKYIGFFPATIIFTVGGMLLLKQRNWKVIALTLVLLIGVIYVVFVSMLHVKLI